MKQIFHAALLCLMAFSISAQTKYIDDTLFVPLRSGEGLGFRIVHKGVKSGTRVEVINQNADSGYSEVRTPDGVTGFMPTRYLVDEPIAKDKLVKAIAERDRAIEAEKALRTQLEELTREKNTLSSEGSSLASSNEKLKKELDRITKISENALKLDRRNQELLEENQQLKNNLELITTENARLKDKSDTDFMMIGSGLVLLGVLLAVIIPWLKPARKTDSWA